MQIIERKGNGHPDTIADNLAENLGLVLKQEYSIKYDRVMHYNVDKVLVSCGKVDYKKGKMVKPVRIVFSGNMTKLKGIKRILKEVVEQTLWREIDNGLKYKVFNHIATTSPDLTRNFLDEKCNDTSFAVGFPQTVAERKVIAVSNELISMSDFNPAIGTDHKVMYIDGKFIIAIAMRAHSRELYNEGLNEVSERIRRLFKIKDLVINAADTEEQCFNTITGTSLEQGDAGMTGRGNRRNGLITPLKPMTMEAYCGKNDQTHIGRIYQDRAQRIADETGKKVLLVNTIGNKIEDFTVHKLN